MTAIRVVVVNGSPRTDSKTMALVSVMITALGRRHPLDVRTIDVYRLGASFSGALSRDEVDKTVEDALRAAETSDLLIAATPVYRGSYTGMFKHFFDLIEQYSLAGKLVLLAATGGGERHSLIIDHALRPLFAFFQALTAPVGLFVSAADFDGDILLNAEVFGRIEIALDDIEPFLPLSSQ